MAFLEGRVQRLEQRINERRDGRSLGQNQKTPEDEHHQEDRQQPEFLSGAHEGPKLSKDGQMQLLKLV